MTYFLEVSDELDKLFSKLSKRDKTTFEVLNKKILEILENPYHYKPLKAPMQNKRRVHISTCFVLIFKIDEERKIVQLLEFDHHDYAYR